MGPKKNPMRTSLKRNVKKVQSHRTGPTAATRAAPKIAAGPEDEAIALVVAPVAVVTMNDEAAVPTTNAAATVQALEGAALMKEALNNQQKACRQHNEKDLEDAIVKKKDF
jgi:hypothetical protein